MNQPETKAQPASLATFEHAIAALIDPDHCTADNEAYLDCADLVARIFGKTTAEVLQAASAARRLLPVGFAYD